MANLRYKLSKTQLAFVKSEARYTWLIGAEREGKSVGFNTPVIMSDGSIKMIQDVVSGDRVMGPDSKAKKVLTLGRGKAMMYEVTPFQGEAFTANGAHILPLLREGSKGLLKKDGDRANVSIENWLKEPESSRDTYRMWRVRTDKRSLPTERVKIKSIKPVGVDNYYGITLGGDHLYLLGDFTVTHNTFASVCALMTHRARCGPFLKKDQDGNPYPMRAAIIRDTHANIKRHYVETVNKGFPGIFKFKDDYHKMTGYGIDADLLGMNNTAATSRLQGGEYDFIQLEEPAPIMHTGNSGINHDVFLTCARRVSAGGNTPKRLMVSMNPAEKEHWTYKEAIFNPLTDTKVFNIKPGENPYLSKSDRVAREEAYRDRPDLAARYDKGLFADVFPGVKITPEYREEIHLAKHRLMPPAHAQYFRFYDGGLTPSMVIACITGAGQLWFLDCVALADGGMRQLIEQKVLPLLARPRYAHVVKDSRMWRDVGDASLDTRDQSDSDHRPSLIIEKLLGTHFERGVQQWDQRKEALKDMLTRSPGGRPFVQVNPYVTEGEPFNRVHSALAGGYCYKVTPSGQVLNDIPDKNNSHSHVGDAISHGVAKLFYRAKEVVYKYDQSKQLKRARGYGVG